MAHYLNPDHVAWKDWVSGEATRTEWFYRTAGDRRSERWKMLANALTSPDYRSNYEFRKTRMGHCRPQQFTQQFLSEKEAADRELASVLSRPGTQVSSRTARGFRLKNHEPTEEEVRLYLQQRTQGARKLPAIPKSQKNDEEIAYEMTQQLKAERAKRRQLESQLEALTYRSS